MTIEEDRKAFAGVSRAVKVVIVVVGALCRHPDVDVEIQDELLARFVAPGTVDYWRALTDAQLEPLREVTGYGDPAVVDDNLVHVPLVPRRAKPTQTTGREGRTWAARSFNEYRAAVRFFPDLEDWRVERLGELGPPQPELLN
jgi:hypothetical protein